MDPAHIQSLFALCDMIAEEHDGETMPLFGRPAGLDYSLDCAEAESVLAEHVDGCNLWHATKGPEQRTELLKAWAACSSSASSRRSAQAEAWFDQQARESAEFYASLTPGMTIHAHNGEGRFIRCEVVARDGDLKLRRVALVGLWPESWLTAESVQVRHLGSVFRPSASSIWENAKAPCHKRYADPQHLQPVEWLGRLGEINTEIEGRGLDGV